MTNADIDNLVRHGDEIGREIDPYDARVVLGAKELLASDPANAYALEVVQDFGNFLKTGVRVDSFTRFMLPIAHTDEEIAEHARLREAHLAWKNEPLTLKEN
jgi:hypothetical protein